MQEVTKGLECLDPWLDDGNIVIAVQGKHFRVHRSVLRFYSEVFRDMFAVPHSDDVEEEIIDGCPVIHLQDSSADVEIMLKALYDRSYMFFPEAPMPISVLSAFLRLGKKYIIRQLFKEGERRLSFDISPLVRASTISAAGNVLFPRVSGIDPFNFMIMNLAKEVGLLSPVVIAALYCCIACPASSVADGYDFDGIQCALSASNKRYCFLVQRYLAEAEKQLFRCLAFPSPICNHRSSPQNLCNSGLLSIIRTIQSYPFTIWMDAWDVGLCVTCRTEQRRKHEEARTRLLNNLPVDLGLGCWENIDKEAEIT